MNKRRIPIFFYGPKPEEPHLTETFLNRVESAKAIGPSYWERLTPKRPEIFFDNQKRQSHLLFMAKALGFERGLLFVVSIQESTEELIRRLTSGGDIPLPLELKRDHNFEIYYPTE